jgi:hypothetical protein
MANEVYSNNMEVSCKAASGKAICAFPDVCFTPPLTPATPPGVPIPYPNTGMASDCTDGSSSVKVSGQEVMLKNKSYFKKSMGDEAGCAPKKGVVTSKNMGKVYFNMWSMDVKIEGENVVRNLDITTHNHASFPGNSPTWPYLDAAAFSGSGPCAGVAKGIKEACVGTPAKPKNLVVKDSKGEVKRKASMEKMCANDKCRKAMKCVISPYSPNNCCPPKKRKGRKKKKKPTPHHVVPKSQFKMPGAKGKRIKLASGAKYKASTAPCICVDGQSHSEGVHGQIHQKTNTKTRRKMKVKRGKTIPKTKRWPVGDAEGVGAAAVAEATGCPKKCIEEQLRQGHLDQGVKKNDQIRPSTAGGDESSTGTGY